MNNDSACQKWIPGSQRLISFITSAPGPGTVYFRVPVPDSRLRVKISVLFIPPAGDAFEFDITGGTTLWLYEADDDLSGVSGRTIPCTNIEGTEAAPTAIPATSPLLGYSREFSTAADAIEGKLVASNVTLGTWILQCRYQPQAVRFTDAEWREIKSGCNPQLTSQPVTL